MKTKKLGLIKNRHEMPVKEFVFEDEIKDVFDMEALKNQIAKKLSGLEKAVIYVTGLTIVTVEVIKYCYSNKISLSLMHFDRDDNDYKEQQVF